MLQHSVKGIECKNEVQVPIVKADPEGKMTTSLAKGLCPRQDRRGCTDADEDESKPRRFTKVY